MSKTFIFYLMTLIAFNGYAGGYGVGLGYTTEGIAVLFLKTPRRVDEAQAVPEPRSSPGHYGPVSASPIVVMLEALARDFL